MNLKKTTILMMMFYSCVNSQENKLDVIATSGPPDISVGWYKINITNYFGDNLIINANQDTGFIEKFIVKYKNHEALSVRVDVFKPIRKPDFSTLENLWYDGVKNELSSIEFEFSELLIDSCVETGRFIATVDFENREITSIVIRKYNKEGYLIYLTDLIKKARQSNNMHKQAL